MNVLERMNTAVNYIEENITEDISMEHLARLTECSSYNFQRMFSFIADMSIVEYIRRRRMSLAALELQKSDIRVIDLAMKYGYDSPVSFTRAFQSVHGISPSKARESNISLKMFPKLTFQIIVKGVEEMNYRIVKTGPFKVFGLEGIISTIGDERYFSNEHSIWQENYKNGKYDKLIVDAGKEKMSMYDTMFVNEMCKVHALINYKKIDATTYGYMQCSFVAPDSKTDGYEVVEIPATTWVVFPCELENWDVGAALNTLNRRFYSEWLPTSEYEKADAAEFEMYGGTEEKGYIELWIPVVKK